jgi:large subunit ribosomal protein L6
MSRLVRKPIAIPPGVEIALDDASISAKGPAGEVAQSIHPDVEVSRQDGALVVRAANSGKKARALAGTYVRLLAQMMGGASAGFERVLELSGVGYRAQVRDDLITLTLGFSHPAYYRLPAGVSASASSQTEIVLRGANKAALGQAAADIRRLRPPEPYKGKGVRYRGEKIMMKETKKK